jgi:hypothetical protein
VSVQSFREKNHKVSLQIAIDSGPQLCGRSMVLVRAAGSLERPTLDRGSVDEIQCAKGHHYLTLELARPTWVFTS